MDPRLLIIETSSKVGQVALAQGHALLSSRRLDETRRHARDLAPAIAELLKNQSWKPRDVEAIIVSRGPGSYTGLRVGIMTAKAFAYATGRALIGVDTFAAIAAQTPPEVLSVDVLADAQQDKVYAQRFIRTAAGAEMQPSAPLAIAAFQEWLQSTLEAHGLRSVGLVTGPLLHKKIGLLPEKVHALKPEDWDPRPASLLKIGLTRYLNGIRDDIWTLEPLYLRPSSAEEKWRAK